jgi:hypothetical protein
MKRRNWLALTSLILSLVSVVEAALVFLSFSAFYSASPFLRFNALGFILGHILVGLVVAVLASAGGFFTGWVAVASPGQRWTGLAVVGIILAVVGLALLVFAIYLGSQICLC